ncbi:MAG: hypothetical protein MJ142_04740 [Clostridia bacterium]|nr:hypothetical protein [Clostridia bacterium]
MRFRRCLLIFILLAVFCTGIARAEGNVCVRVEKREFTREEVQKYINRSAISLELASGESMAAVYDPESRQEFIQLAAEHFVTVGVLREKLAGIGKEIPEPEEENELRAFSRTWYEEVWQNFSERLAETYPDGNYPESFVTEVMTAAGYDMDDLYDMALLELQQQRLIELYCADVQVTADEAMAFYTENYVEPDREKYENNPVLFESDVIVNRGSAAYVPDGFFYIRFLILNPNGERMREIEKAQYAYEDSMAAWEAAGEALKTAALNGENLESAQTLYLQEEQNMNNALTALTEAREAAAADYAPLMETIRQALNDGADFSGMISMYGEKGNDTAMGENGYLFHPQSGIWYPDFVAQVSRLEKPGDLTEPFFAGTGVYIVQRGEDLPGGPYDPGEELLEQIRGEMLYERQTSRLNELADEWRQDMDVTVDLTGLEFPIY